MAYIGRDIEYGVLEKQSLTADGTSTDFTLNYGVGSSTALIVSVGGIVQEPDVGYTTSGSTISFATAPATGDGVFVVFIERELITSTAEGIDWVAHETEIGDGTTTQFTLSYSPTQAQDLAISLNGINQTPGTDFTVSGTTLTFSTAPANGLQILIYHLAESGGASNLADGSVTNPKIVSMDASKLTGSLPSEIQAGSFATQYQDLSTLALHWASVDNKVALNLTDDFIDHFQDDSGWVAYNGVAAVSSLGDASSNAYTVTKTGNVTSSTAQTKVGSNSIHFPGSGSFRNGAAGDLLTLAHDAAWNFPDGAATIEWWMKSPLASVFSGGSGKGLFGHNPSGGDPVSGWEFYMNGSGRLQFLGSNDGNQSNLTGTTNIGDNAWHHVALTWDGTTITLWVDGTSEATFTDSSPFGSQSTLLRIGTAFSIVGDVDGYYDQIRISNVARYSATFTPSTTQFTSDANTKLLIHGDAIAAVANTGSENVYRASGEYVASGAQTSDSNTKLLIHSDTTDGSSTFVDSSGTHTIGVVGNLQHSTAQYKFGGSSIAFDGTGDYISIPDHADIQFGSSDFTIEFWFRTNGTGNSYAWELAHKGSPGSDSLNWWLGNNGSQAALQVFTDAGTVDLRGGPNLADQQWHHLALVRNGSSWAHYADGTAIDTQTLSGTVRPASGSPFNLGVCNANGAGDFNGHMDEVRISNSARYTANFTPSSAIHEIISTTATATGSLLSTTSTADSTVSKATGIMLYKDGEGTNTIGTDLKAYFSADNGSNWTEAASYGSPTTFDGTTKVIPLGETTMSNTGTAVKLKAAWANQQASSGSAKIISPIGNASHSSSQVKVGSSSMYFDGSSTTGVYTTATSSDWAWGTGDFTAECWINPTSISGDPMILGNSYGTYSSTSTLWRLYVNASGGNKLKYGVANQILLTSTASISTSTWTHIALSRQSGTSRMYINGVQDGTVSDTVNLSGVREFFLGNGFDGTDWNGYIDEVRISNTARYTANFTPSTTAFTSDANTVLLIHSNESSESTTFTDSSSNTHAITAVGNAKHQPPLKKIGTSSLYCDGVGDLISVADSDDFAFTGDYTIEFWIYYVGTPSNGTHICGQGGNAASNFAFMFRTEPSGFFLAGSSNGTTQRLITTTTDMSDAWHHVSLVRSGTSQKVYINGTQEGSTLTHSDTVQNVAANWEFGGNSNQSSYINAYFDEIRFSDTARYTANFTPSTTAFTTDANTKLLIHGDDTLGTIARTSSADRWAGNGTSHVTFSGSDIKVTTGDKQIYIPEVINGDFEITGTWYGSTGVNSTGQSINRGMALGVYATSETYTDALDTDNMTQVWYYDAPNQGSGQGDSFGYAQTSQGNFTPTNGDTFKMCRIGSTFYWYFADTLRHTWTQTYSGPVRIVLNWSGNVNLEILNFAWSGDLIPIIDSSPVTGKIAQLHGWAVNY
jgi:hypothetical protein